MLKVDQEEFVRMSLASRKRFPFLYSRQDGHRHSGKRIRVAIKNLFAKRHGQNDQDVHTDVNTKERDDMKTKMASLKNKAKRNIKATVVRALTKYRYGSSHSSTLKNGIMCILVILVMYLISSNVWALILWATLVLMILQLS